MRTGPLARWFRRSFAPLTHSLAPPCSLIRWLALSFTAEFVGNERVDFIELRRCHSGSQGADTLPSHSGPLFPSHASWIPFLGGWAAQGNFLTINSPGNTGGRNAGIFWGLLQCSLLFGNLFVFFEFQGEISIDADHRWARDHSLPHQVPVGWHI